MDNCKYRLIIDGSIFNFTSQKELSDFIVEHKIKKGKSIKFSTDLSNRQEIVKIAIESQSKSKYDEAKDYVSTYDFLQEEHNLGKGPVLLVPSVRNIDYIKNRVQELKKQNPNINEILLEVNLKKELEEANKMSKLGIGNLAYNTLINKDVYSKEVTSKIYSFIDQIEEFNKVTYTKEQKDNFKDNIRKELIKFVEFSERIGISGVVQPYLLNKTAKLKSIPDIVIVDGLGDPSIIDVTISRKPFIDWDPAKLLNQDYKLGLQRQLLQSICPTENGALYINSFFIPEVGGKLDLNKIIFESIRRDNTPKLNSLNGEITKNIKKLVPSDFTHLHTREDSNKHSEILIEEMLPKSYEFKSKFIMTNKVKLIEKIKASKTDLNDKYSFINHITNERVNIEKESDIESVVDKYISDYNESKHSEIVNLKRSILDAIGANKTIQFGRGGVEVAINRTFEKYLDGNWELIDNNLFTNQDMLVFKNNKYNTVEVVGITANSLNNRHNLGLGDTLLGKFKNNNDANKDRRILPSNTKNIESIKILSILNNVPEIFDGYTLSNIHIFNYIDSEKKSDYENLDNLIYNFNQLYKIINKDAKLQITNNFEKNGIIKKSNYIDILYREILYTLSESKESSLRSLSSGDRADYHEDKLKWLYDAREKLIKIHPELKENPGRIPSGYGEEKYALLQMLDHAIAYSLGMKFSFDPIMPQLGIKFSDLGHIFQTTFLGEGSEYDSKGNRVVGLLGGSYFATTDSLISKDRVIIFDLISEGHTVLRSAYQKIQTKTVFTTDKFYKDSNRSGLEKTLLGNATPYHERLLKKVNGRITDEFKTKNPYDLKEDLKSYEREYLKYILWEMYKFKRNIPKEHQELDYKSAEKLPEFDNYKKESIYYELPLMKKFDINKWGNVTTDSVRNMISKRFEEFKDDIDPRKITELQRSESKELVENCTKMYNEFSMDENFRTRMITEYKPEYFETNLDTLLLKYSFASLRENIMNKVLTNVNVAMGVLKFQGYTSGTSEETEKAIKEMITQVKISVYGINPIEGEIVDTLSIFKQVQKVASIAMITLRPVLMMKEVIAGIFKNVSYSYTKVYGDDSFKEKDIVEAYKQVIWGKNQTVAGFTLIDHLNNLYGIANTDINTIVTKTKTDRMGLFKFFSEHLYWMNTAPDYLNRMTLFVAKMLHDGCYEAHSFNKQTGEFIYNPKKDKRFEIYFNKREQYNYKGSENDDKYNDQRSLYLTMLESFNKENEKFNKPLLDEKLDLIPRAYTHVDRESIKIFADMAYGFYDHERSAPWKHMAFGSIFGQFLTYWPSTVKYYFGKRIESKTGQWLQKSIPNEDGENQLLWLKDTFDNEGNLIGQEETLENTGRKAMHFMGQYHEGLMNALGMCCYDILHGNLEKTPEDRKRRAMLALHDLFIGMLLAAFVRILLEDFDKEIKTEEKSAIDQALQGTTRAFYKAFKQFDPFSTVFTAFQWEPAAVGMSKKIVDNFMDVMAGNGSLEKMFRSNLKMLEIIPQTLEDFQYGGGKQGGAGAGASW